ncbi:hypothetical protein GCM10010512_26580 [Streptomyces thermoviolaceus subsp. thermoviolaceus]|nr:hypothetical protein GCM10010512_26580 [Streptomyces thermoviolaceus subsp. thermoviolaceus]
MPVCRLRRPAPGVPGTGRFRVTGLLSPAVRSLSLERGPTTHGTTRAPHAPEGHAWLSSPPLAGTDTGTNDAAQGPVTRRTGEDTGRVRTAVGEDGGR